ncbi:MAG: GTPase ObgE [Candidatus Omnitrophica bacterium]|nr:GTPase ObgE [Candidatus Omnitrophota bacterium]
MFIDHVEINIKAGDGGDGCHSFSKARSQRFKRPDGGDGGKGGDIRIVSDHNVQTLIEFYYRKHFKADSGTNGGSNHKNGADGKICEVRVPVGTVVRDSSEDIMYCDMSYAGRSVVIAKGGEGGKGNSRRRVGTPGKDGEEKDIILELKLVADVGIIGYPSVGKSSLISRASNAKPKIAAYPFTTKTPMLGLVRLDPERSFVICDIPGLIEGAHAGRGLGDAFLRHVERTRALVHMIDMAAVEGRDPVEDLASINKELKLYNAALLKRPQIIAVNKMDLAESSENLKRFRKKIRKRVYPISCVTGEGIKELMEAVYSKLSNR